MFSVLALLLYFNLDAQSRSGLALSAIGAGLFLLPLSAGLLAFAFSAPCLVRRFGPRRVLTSAMLLTVLASIVIGVAAPLRMRLPLGIGLFMIGAGLALPYATAPRLALAALPATHAGSGSGMINAATFLGGSIGIAAGAVAFSLAGLPAVLMFIALAALLGIYLCLRLEASS
jgi:MFS family permease